MLLPSLHAFVPWVAGTACSVPSCLYFCLSRFPKPSKSLHPPGLLYYLVPAQLLTSSRLVSCLLLYFLLSRAARLLAQLRPPSAVPDWQDAFSRKVAVNGRILGKYFGKYLILNE
jgi:hypothetical protein